MDVEEDVPESEYVVRDMTGGGSADAASGDAATAEENAEAAAAQAAGGGRKLTEAELREKVLAMRAIKAENAKKEAQAAEIKRRADASKALETNEALRKASAQRAADEVKREKAAKEREMLYQRLELAKDKAEREARSKGAVSEATAANLKYLQDTWDGKAPALPPGDPLVAIAGKVKALTVQKAEDIGLTAARTIALLLGKVLEAPAEAKFRKIPWVQGKPAHARIAPASAGLGLLLAVGWQREKDAEGSDALVLPDAAPLDLLKAAAADIQKAIDSGAFNKE
jgi:hypothetical protein